MSIKESITLEGESQLTSAPQEPANRAMASSDIPSPQADVQHIQAERRELARDFVTLKHTISQLRSERDRLALQNRDLQMRLDALEMDYSNLFSYVEGQSAKG